jgi:hypothetical protein
VPELCSNRPEQHIREEDLLRSFRLLSIVTPLLVFVAAPARAQEGAYFVTYDHYLEEPGNLEIALANTTGMPKNGHAAYHAPWLEVEYGFTGWWTSELYLEGVTTWDGHGFTGWRWENRFRPLRSEHRVNPVLYVEYEDIDEASRIQKEVVGSGAIEFAPIAELRAVHARELEGKLILSSVAGVWNISENMIVEKNLSKNEGVEFGYSVGVSRPTGTVAGGSDCHLCAENFIVGVEAYGGLGSTEGFAASEQRHYLAPVVGWHVTSRTMIKASAGIGLTHASDRALLRVGVSYELPGGRR